MISERIAAILLGNDLENIADSTSTGKDGGFSTAASAWQLIGLVILLVVILIAAYYTSRFVGGFKMGQMRNSNFKVIDVYRITPNKALQIVKIGNKYIVISIGKDTVNFITELDESEVMTKEMIAKDKQSFKQILEKLKDNKL